MPTPLYRGGLVPSGYFPIDRRPLGNVEFEYFVPVLVEGFCRAPIQVPVKAVRSAHRISRTTEK